jgi:hypothetical protein
LLRAALGLTKPAGLLTKPARLLSKLARLLSKLARLLSKLARLLSKLTRLLTKLTRLLPKLTGLWAERICARLWPKRGLRRRGPKRIGLWLTTRRLSRLLRLARLPALSLRAALAKDCDELPLAIFLPLVVNHDRFIVAVGCDADQASPANLLGAWCTADRRTEHRRSARLTGLARLSLPLAKRLWLRGELLLLLRKLLLRLSAGLLRLLLLLLLLLLLSARLLPECLGIPEERLRIIDVLLENLGTR